jgi:hypothetical protein
MASISAKQWLEQWRRAGPLLERIRWRELRRMDLRARQQAIAAVLEASEGLGQPRHTSGLVELQRLLAKGRK